MPDKYPESIARFLEGYHAGGVTERDCVACSSPCCSLGGFALLENVVQIYALYSQGGLKRSDYEFEPGLSFAEFAFTYFEVYKRTVTVDGRDTELMLFHMRSIAPGGQLIAIPATGDYWETRTELFRLNPWLNQGCVFLSHSVQNWPSDDGDSSRHCVLHTPLSGTHLTAKPVDCVFYTCNVPIQARVPSEEQSAAWFRLLAECYPSSVQRFKELIQRDATLQPPLQITEAVGSPISPIKPMAIK